MQARLFELGSYNGRIDGRYSSETTAAVNAFQKATGIPIPYSIKPRRPGDIDIYYSDPTKAKRELGWEAKLSLEDMCADAWRWQKNNPRGYRD